MAHTEFEPKRSDTFLPSTLAATILLILLYLAAKGCTNSSGGAEAKHATETSTPSH